MSKILYHGTKEESGKLILKDGFIDPKGTEIKYGDRKPSLRPQGGKVYMTHSIQYATIYAIGANMIGHDDYPSDSDIEKHGRYCYVFEFDQDELDDDMVHPDEDNIGELLHLYYNNETEWNGYDLSKIKSSEFRAIVNLAERKLTEPQLRNLKSKFTDYDWYAKSGKRLMPHLTPSMIKLLISMGAHTAHSGKVYIKRAFKFDRKKNKLLKPDASNFFELAREIKVKPRKVKTLKESFTFERFLNDNMLK